MKKILITRKLMKSSEEYALKIFHAKLNKEDKLLTKLILNLLPQETLVVLLRLRMAQRSQFYIQLKLLIGTQAVQNLRF